MGDLVVIWGFYKSKRSVTKGLGFSLKLGAALDEPSRTTRKKKSPGKRREDELTGRPLEANLGAERASGSL